MKKMYKYYPVLLVLCSFSPYVVKSLGIKAEHLIVIPFFLLTLLVGCMNRATIKKEAAPIIVLWTCFMVIVSVRTVLSSEGYDLIAAISEFGNFVLPLMVMIFYMFDFDKGNDGEVATISKIIKLYTAFLLVNAVIIIASIAGFNMEAILQFYWKGSVAIDSLGNGRFTGLFNQPMESGLAYSIGVVGWLYLVEKQTKLSLKNVLTIVLLVVGGLASVSKVFILGGFLIFCWGAWRNKVIRKSLIKTMFVLIPLVYVAYQLLKSKWYGMNYLMRFFNIEDGQLINTLTSGRFGGENSMRTLFGGIWEQHPLIGLGFGANEVSDSQWFQVFGSGGTIGVAIFILITIVLLVKALEFNFVSKSSSESKLFMYLVIICTISSIGAPVYTLNRSAIVLWCLLGLLLSCKGKLVKRRSLVSERPFHPVLIKRASK